MNRAALPSIRTRSLPHSTGTPLARQIVQVRPSNADGSRDMLGSVFTQEQHRQ